MDSRPLEIARSHLEDAEGASDREERMYHIRQARQLLKAFDEVEIVQHRKMAK
ncbi:MAG: hypothetical protein ABEJ58_07170 [Halodesulfurarchaeum sp.]